MTPTNQPPQPKQPVTGKKKRRWGRLILWILVLGFLAMQFFQPDKNNNSVVMSNDISSLAAMPDTVNRLLHTACYDCHSNNTNYPWYANIQPVGWWLSSHIKDGKRHLNFNEFAGYTPSRKKEKLEEVVKSLREGWMPLSSYTWIHKDAKLTDTQKEAIISWAESVQKTVTAVP